MHSQCSFPACERPYFDEGHCRIHLRHLRKGKPLRPLKPVHGPRLERFWLYVDKRGPDECWEWKGGLDEEYGAFRWNGNRRAHRVMWELTHGEKADGCVCHTCDNPPCVNPAHLWVGTRGDNMRDMAAKGRHWQPKGERHPRAKLTEADVLTIRAEAPSCSAEYRDTGRRFGVSGWCVSSVIKRRSWTHI